MNKLSVKIVVSIENGPTSEYEIDLGDLMITPNCARDLKPYNGVNPVDECVMLIEYELTRRMLNDYKGESASPFEVPLIRIGDGIRKMIKDYIS